MGQGTGRGSAGAANRARSASVLPTPTWFSKAAGGKKPNTVFMSRTGPSASRMATVNVTRIIPADIDTRSSEVVVVILPVSGVTSL